MAYGDGNRSGYSLVLTAGHCAFDKRRVNEAHVAVGVPLQQVAHCENGAAEVGQHDDALATIGALDGVPNRVAVGPQRAFRAAAGGHDPHLGSRHLGGEIGKPASQLKAVGHQYNPDHSDLPPSAFLA